MVSRATNHIIVTSMHKMPPVTFSRCCLNSVVTPLKT